MVTVNYTHEYQYTPLSGFTYPALALTIRHAQSLDILGILDTGATFSLFSGDVALAIGITNINQGESRELRGANDSHFSAFGHDVELIIENNIIREMVYFPEHRLSHNLLGRTFLSNLQVGFRENEQQFYINYIP